MKEGDVVGGGLVPTDQNAPEAVQPAVSAFHHPTAGFEPSLLFDGLSRFASAPDVGGEAELVQGAAHLSEVVALVQAQTLGVRAIALQMFCKGFSAGQSAENRWVREIRTMLKGLGVGIRQMSA